MRKFFLYLALTVTAAIAFTAVLNPVRSAEAVSAVSAAAEQNDAEPASLKPSVANTGQKPAVSAVDTLYAAPDISGEMLQEKLAILSYARQKTRQENTGTKKPVHVPVLYYHSISDTPIGIRILSVTTADFEEQMKFLAENGYTPIYLNEDPAQYSKPVVITFDDGYVDNYFNAYPILEKYQIKATIFIITDFVDKPGYLTTEQIRSMELVSFQSHTVSHRKLAYLSKDEILSELWESQVSLARLTGKRVYALCYPIGSYDSRVIEIASRYYSCAVTIREGIETKILGNYRIIRQFISRDNTLADFRSELGA